MEKVNFKENYNGKLFADYVGTLRLADEKYYAGAQVEIYIRGEYIGEAEIECVQSLKFIEINNALSYVDMGVPAYVMAGCLKTFYPEVRFFPSTELMYVVLRITRRQPTPLGGLMDEWMARARESFSFLPGEAQAEGVDVVNDAWDGVDLQT